MMLVTIGLFWMKKHRWWGQASASVACPRRTCYSLRCMTGAGLPSRTGLGQSSHRMRIGHRARVSIQPFNSSKFFNLPEHAGSKSPANSRFDSSHMEHGSTLQPCNNAQYYPPSGYLISKF
jgi:hypothetical protein